MKAFERVSWYKTIAAGAQLSNSHFTYDELMPLMKEKATVTADLLKADLLKLLELDAEWLSIINKIGCAVLEKARLELTKDAYIIYVQLQLLGLSSGEIFDEFTPDNWVGDYTPLGEVLRAEGLGMKKSFVSFGKHYCQRISEWEYTCTEDIFNSLSNITGFDSWMRAFYDLHNTINDPVKPSVSFKQSRIVDALIVMSFRTEIVLREMFRNKLDKTKINEDMAPFLRATMPELEEESSRFVECACNKISDNTKLNSQPRDIFKIIDDMTIKGASKKKIFFISAILKFIAARNYFAHHAYKDEELNIRTSKLAREILESIFATLLFFEKNKLP